ncbi:MAG: signal transduction histidine kinase [Salibacteraceae bacterium]|jgi:signal transduction histidine kinase
MANGTISFKSDIDKGTIFTVEIPVEKIKESL